MPYCLQLVLSFVVELIVYHGHYIVISMHKQCGAECSLPCVLLAGHMSGGSSPGMRRRAVAWGHLAQRSLCAAAQPFVTQCILTCIGKLPGISAHACM
jgi:hypothetical protein